MLALCAPIGALRASDPLICRRRNKGPATGGPHLDKNALVWFRFNTFVYVAHAFAWWIRSQHEHNECTWGTIRIRNVADDHDDDDDDDLKKPCNPCTQVVVCGGYGWGGGMVPFTDHDCKSCAHNNLFSVRDVVGVFTKRLCTYCGEPQCALHSDPGTLANIHGIRGTRHNQGPRARFRLGFV